MCADAYVPIQIVPLLVIAVLARRANVHADVRDFVLLHAHSTTGRNIIQHAFDARVCAWIFALFCSN